MSKVAEKTVLTNDINLEQARGAVTAAVEKSKELNVKMDIAIVDAGGNLKALLPPPCRLSLPAVAITDHDFHIPNSQILSSVNFECENSIFVVAMLQENPMIETQRV